MNRIKIIAEIGCNHNGREDMARMMIDNALKCGVDAVKFQTFNANALISKYAPKAEYQKVTTGEEESQLEMTAGLELSHDAYLRLREHAILKGLEVFSTPFDLESIIFLKSIGQNVWKIPSGEITNLPYLEEIGKLKCDHKKVILSTGMSTIQEIRNCLEILLKNGTKEEEITILHCNTEYPTPDRDANVSAIKDLRRSFPQYRIGFSDHTVGAVAAVIAVSEGISLIEKHFTLDKNLPGPDHKASATPEEMRELVENVRRAEIMLGNGKKEVSKSECKNKVVARKSIVANTNIKAGDIFSDKNITCKRPGNGISPMEWYNLIGKEAQKDFTFDELIKHSDFEWQETKS